MLKYIITKQGEIIIGNVGHFELSRVVHESDIISAGRLRFKNGKLETYDKSYTFDIDSREEDADIIKNNL